MSESTKEKQLDPKQQAFLSNYLDPQSDTWSNALQSAISAGYSREYGENIMNQMPTWLSENLGRTNLVNKALVNLDEALDDNDNKTIKWDATKFSLTRLSKDFRERKDVDVTTAGEPIKTINYITPDVGDNS